MAPYDRESVDVFLQPGDFHFGSSGVRIRTILASCVSIVMWHRRRRIGGMCHYVLPERPSRPAAGLDGRYAGDAMRLFLGAIARAGSAPREYDVRLVGGGRLFSHNPDIGQRNIDEARRLLRHYGLAVHDEHLAGVGYRHVVFDIDTGIVWLKHVTDASLAWKKA